MGQPPLRRHFSCKNHALCSCGDSISASTLLVGFGELNDNTIKGLTSLLSVEQEIEFTAYTCGLWNEKCI